MFFSPSRFKKLKINSKYFKLVDLLGESKQSVNLLKIKGYYNYIEIGSISNSTGSINPTKLKSIDISTNSVYKIQKGDILVSTVRTYLGGIGIVNSDQENTVSSKALIVLRDLKQNVSRFYIFGIMRTSFFIDQTNLILNASMYPRMEKESFDTLQIPFPTTANHPEPQKVQDLVSLLVQNIIDKEEQIQTKNQKIDELIEKELLENQKDKSSFSYSYPKISEIKSQGRLDTGLYEREFKGKIGLFDNYIHGSKTLQALGFKTKKGPNLAISVIGQSYYSQTKKSKNFQRLILSKNVDDFGGIRSVQYIGNTKSLPTVKKGDFMLFARGDIGKVLYIGENLTDSTSNFDVFFVSGDLEIETKIYSMLFLRYLRNIDFWKMYAVQGSAAPSLTDYHLKLVKIPLFPEFKQQEIAKEHYNQVREGLYLSLDNYLNREKQRNQELGIYQLNMEIFDLREKLEDLVYKIVNEEVVKLEEYV